MKMEDETLRIIAYLLSLSFMYMLGINHGMRINQIQEMRNRATREAIQKYKNTLRKLSHE